MAERFTVREETQPTGDRTMSDKVMPWISREIPLLLQLCYVSPNRTLPSHHIWTLAHDGELYFAPLENNIQVR